MNGIFVALGSNLSGTYACSQDVLNNAVAKMPVCVVAQSQWWRSAPVPVSDDPDYINGVIQLDTDISPRELMQILLDIEMEFGRIRTHQNAPRILDLDLIAYDNRIMHKDEFLILPHPRMHLRAFVLRPLFEIAPDWVHPVTKESIADLIRNLSPEQVVTHA
jgi:2-amino-4-hydroxy-6-hydroxymethyldihydropteridine diphosphokinase